jgi:hypothetical protein
VAGPLCEGTIGRDVLQSKFSGQFSSASSRVPYSVAKTRASWSVMDDVQASIRKKSPASSNVGPNPSPYIARTLLRWSKLKFYCLLLQTMQDPASEIAQVVTILTTTVSPDIQKAAVEKFFSSDAGFSHPICAVKRGPNSRDTLLGIYQ